jgi:DNA-directed RNA polymerase subunit M/transcription elongation factor TFIIS
MDTLTVKCPDCANILIVDKKTGEVLEVRKPILENSTGDRFEDARRKVLDSKSRAERLFEEARKKEKEKFSRLEALFQEKKEELKDQPITRPDRPIDYD